MNEKDKGKDSIYTTFGIYGAIGFQLGAAVVGGLLLGNVIDKKAGTLPIFTLIGLTAGFAGGLWNLIRILNWHKKRKSP